MHSTSGVSVIVIKFDILLQYLHNTMHFLDMAFVGWETENWDRGREKHTDKIIKQLGRIFLFYLYKICKRKVLRGQK